MRAKNAILLALPDARSPRLLDLDQGVARKFAHLYRG
jgi:hypothetical protein